jgi:hypothetical protein
MSRRLHTPPGAGAVPAAAAPARRVLSLGAGVQSTTPPVLAADGQLPRLDAAVFADTGWEPRAVYDHLDAPGVPAREPVSPRQAATAPGGPAYYVEETTMIGALASTCWIIVNSRGEPDDVDGNVAHHATRADAQAAADELNADRPDARWSAVEQPAPCLVAECDDCLYEFDEDEWFAHFTGRDHALMILASGGWVVTGPGELLCPQCACGRAGHHPTMNFDGARCRRCWRALPAGGPATVSGTIGWSRPPRLAPSPETRQSRSRPLCGQGCRRSRRRFTYYGGKTRVADRIVDLLPPHQHYVEPFAGSLAVLLAKRPSKLETVNDLDGDMCAFWRALREQPAALIQACALTPHSREEYGRSADRDGCSDVERARRVWVKLTQGRAGVLRRSGWRTRPARTCPCPGISRRTCSGWRRERPGCGPCRWRTGRPWT